MKPSTKSTNGSAKKNPLKSKSNGEPSQKETKTLKKSTIFFSPIQPIQPRPIKPRVIMADPTRLASALTCYLNFSIGPTRPPTFEGLALAAGFNSFAQLKQAVLNDSHSSESRDALIIACAHVADHYQQHGLLESLNPSFIKYLLSAYLNISEKHLHESHTTADKTITIRWEDPAALDDPHHDPTRALVERQRIAETTTSQQALKDELAELELEELL